jgi:hypothetical protein
MTETATGRPGSRTVGARRAKTTAAVSAGPRREGCARLPPSIDARTGWPAGAAGPGCASSATRPITGWIMSQPGSAKAESAS